MKRMMLFVFLGMYSSYEGFCAEMPLETFVAKDASLKEISFVNPRLRPAKPGHNSAAFVTIRNQSPKTLKLIKVSSTIAKRAELHRSFEESGIYKMRPIEAVEVKGGESTKLESGGLHIMLMDVTEEISATPKNVEPIFITLFFESGEQANIPFHVEKSGAPCH